MRYSLQSLLLATPCFGMALVEFVAAHRFEEYAREMASQGKFVCGMGAPSPVAGVFLIAAGTGMLARRYVIATIFILISVLISPGGF